MTTLAEPPLRQPNELRELRGVADHRFVVPAQPDPAIDDWGKLKRFLVLGREDGSYRATDLGLSLESAHSVFHCLVADGPRVVRTIVDVAQAASAARPEPLLFVLALAASDRAAGETRAAALRAIPAVCRTGEALLHFARYVDDLRGWGRGLRRAIADWYRQPLEHLVPEVLMAPAQEGWTHRDLLRLAHPKAPSAGHQELFRWIVRGWDEGPRSPVADLRPISGLERARRAASREELIGLIHEYGLPPGAVPAVWSGDHAVWRALIDQMTVSDLLRSLGPMAQAGILAGESETSAKVVARLSDRARLQQSDVQPLEVLTVWTGFRGDRTFENEALRTLTPSILVALEAAFHRALNNASPSGKRWLVALDVSGSMGGGELASMPGLSPRLAAMTMAMTAAAVERRPTLVGFTAGSDGPGGRWGGGSPRLTPLDIEPGMSLVEVVNRVQRLPMGGVDCALPMQWALRKKLPVDVFAVYTDAETWWGNVSPVEALRAYRERMGIAAKLIVVGLGSEGFRIADSHDAGMLDVIGFDAQTPRLIADFASG